jgi:uncharacterized protein YndB with AHSA1/START domain
MKKLEFKIEIAAKRDKVWNTLVQPDTFREWVNDGFPGAYYEGNWKQGENIRFLSETQNGGTLANLAEVRKPEYINAKHIAVITADGAEDRDSEQAKGWIGTTEEYFLTDKGDKTEVRVVINTTPEWESMFTDSWPRSLKKLKEISERKKVSA